MEIKELNSFKFFCFEYSYYIVFSEHLHRVQQNSVFERVIYAIELFKTLLFLW